ncbi:MAG: hypothetical protein CMD66_04765 [Gammaproteobacteria bacterium]|nr:hypothetical protein [Gammaproteobacteria bacterium]
MLEISSICLNPRASFQMALVDIKEGDEVVTDFRVTEEKISQFAVLVDDFAPVHFDSEFARNQGFDDTIAHGLFTASFVSGVLGNYLPGPESVINELNLKYHQPVYKGQTIQVLVSVQRVVHAVSAVYLTITISEKSSSKKVVSGRAICSFPSKDV